MSGVTSRERCLWGACAALVGVTGYLARTQPQPAQAQDMAPRQRYTLVQLEGEVEFDRVTVLDTFTGQLHRIHHGHEGRETAPVALTADPVSGKLSAHRVTTFPLVRLDSPLALGAELHDALKTKDAQRFEALLSERLRTSHRTDLYAWMAKWVAAHGDWEKPDELQKMFVDGRLRAVREGERWKLDSDLKD